MSSSNYFHITGRIKNTRPAPTMESKNSVEEAFATTSRRYGNDKTPDEVFDDRLRPQPWELRDALAETEHLSEQEAAGIVKKHTTSSLLKVEGESEYFDNEEEFESYALQGRYKVAQAIWIYELIDAYRFPDFPDECRECGTPLGGSWVGHPDTGEPGVLCINCADIDQPTDLRQDYHKTQENR